MFYPSLNVWLEAAAVAIEDGIELTASRRKQLARALREAANRRVTTE